MRKLDKKLSYNRGTMQCAMLVNLCYVSRAVELLRFQTAKVTYEVIQGHWQWCHLIGYIRFPISLIHCDYVCLALFPRYYHSFPKI